MKATEAVDRVDPDRWRATPAAERLRLLRLAQANTGRHFDELVAADCRAKGFTSPGHLIMTSRRGRLDLSTRFARYAVRPTWPRLFAPALALAFAFATTRTRSRPAGS